METALVRLTWVEVRAAANHAVHRRIYHEELGTPHRANIPREGMPWDFEVNGAVAELAFCKLLNCYWSGLELDVREEIELMQKVLELGEFSTELRVLTLQTCEICRLEDAGRVRERKDYF